MYFFYLFIFCCCCCHKTARGADNGWAKETKSLPPGSLWHSTSTKNTWAAALLFTVDASASAQLSFTPIQSWCFFLLGKFHIIHLDLKNNPLCLCFGSLQLKWISVSKKVLFKCDFIVPAHFVLSLICVHVFLCYISHILILVADKYNVDKYFSMAVIFFFLGELLLPWNIRIFSCWVTSGPNWCKPLVAAVQNRPDAEMIIAQH